MTKISNATPGPRGLHTKAGLVWVEGYSTVDAEFENDKQLQAAMDTGWFVKGERKAPGGEDGSDVASLTAEVDRLTRANAVLETENGQLKADLEAAKGDGGQGDSTLEAKHRGAGSYSILDGDVEVREKLTKEQAEAFNALDEAGKIKWLADNPKPAA